MRSRPSCNFSATDSEEKGVRETAGVQENLGSKEVHIPGSYASVEEVKHLSYELSK